MNKSAALRRIASLEQRLADLEEQLATVEEGHQAHSLFDEYDYNQDSLIDSAEWGGSHELFEALDTDMDGVLTPSEVSVGMGNSFSKLASRRAAKHKGIARRVLNKKAHNLFETYDLNMDGVIDTTEWGGSFDAFDALDTNMDSLLDESEVAMGVGPSFSKLSYRQEEQASRRKASLGEPNQYEILNMIVKAVRGVIVKTEKPDPRYLIKPATLDNSVEAIISFGPGVEHLDLFITANENEVVFEGYMWMDQILDLSFKRGDNSWKFKVPAIINKAKENY